MAASTERIHTTPRDRADLASVWAQALDATGLRANEAARQLGVCPATVSQWTSGDREVPAAALLWALRTAAPTRRRALLDLLGERLWGHVEAPHLSADAEADDAVEAMSEAVSAIVRARRDGIQVEEIAVLRLEATGPQTTFGCRRAR